MKRIVFVQRCPVCGERLPAGRRAYCSDRCRQQAKADRYEQSLIRRYGSVEAAPPDRQAALSLKRMGASIGYNWRTWSVEPEERKERLERRSGGVCERCRRRKATDVHHLRRPARSIRDLQHLCRRCHMEVTLP